MDIYKEAFKKKVRFTTETGVLTVERLYELSRNRYKPVLTKLIKKYHKQLESDTSKDEALLFLTTSVCKDTLLQLKFDLVKDIYLTLQAEEKADYDKANRKEEEQELLRLIKEKKDEEKGKLSIEELQAKLSALKNK